MAAVVAGPELFTRLTITLWGDFVPLVIAAYSVARHCRARSAWAGAAVICASLLVVFFRVPAIGTVANIPFNAVPFVSVFAAGRVLRRRGLHHQAARDQARQLQSERDESVRAAVADERSRIARELHDIVAHCVSVMVVQAGAAEDLLGRDPAGARTPLRLVQDTGRQAVDELRRMLGLLRSGDAQLALTPQPGTADLTALVEHMSQAGLPVTLRVEGEPQPLPPGLELTVYRIAQEALTNTLKHAGRASALLSLRYGDGVVSVDITDTGQGAGATGTGHGLIGMRERVCLYGGSLVAGPAPGGGFAVRVELPADGAA